MFYPLSLFLCQTINSAQDEIMRRAIEVAKRRERGEAVGAVLVKEGEVISEGWNRLIKVNDATAHAEIETLRKAGQASWKIIAYSIPPIRHA